jgi:hypothetical protein
MGPAYHDVCYICSVFSNGEWYSMWAYSRGLRQEDPISSYLFLLCAEGLSSMLCQATKEGHLSGVPTSKKGLHISHLFFADENLIFCQTNLSQWGSLMSILRRYEEVSEQCLNNNKTSIFFSVNTTQVEKYAILEISKILVIQRYDT